MKAEEYLNLPYHVNLVFDRDEQGNSGWIADIEELPGCIAQGSTPDEAVENLQNAMLGWISVAQEDGLGIPLPQERPAYSGKLHVRMPPGLHAYLVELAGREGVSLNQLVTTTLAGAVGWRQRATSDELQTASHEP